MSILALFDMDGTLVTGQRTAHWRAFAQAWKSVYKIDHLNFDLNDMKVWHRHEGKTDSGVLFDVAKDNGIRNPLSKLEDAILAMDYSYAKRKVVTRALPGVPKLVKALAKNDICLGLVTGNLEPIARKKLKLIGLNSSFPVGGFGNDSRKRSDLVRIAIRRAAKLYGKHFSEVFLFGDTPRDIEAAKESNVKCIAVATGPFSLESLKNCAPFAVLPDLTDIKKVLSLLNG
ncbi:MAG: HAD family hydrolase [Candidatus Woesearchaeota archaeon]